MHEGPTENRLGELGSLFKYYYYYCYIIKTTHKTFRDCLVHFFRQPFSKYLYKALERDKTWAPWY